jgi:penicillin-insensitive murein endopeptidase
VKPSLVFLLVVAYAATGCISAPSPLTPGYAGAVGAPGSGVQTDGVELPHSGPGFVRFRPQGVNHFGRPRLVAALTRIAAELAAESRDAPPLVIGDLSARYGGKIDGHQSHRTGRDVDILFHFVTPAGARVTAPGFVHVGDDGLARVHDTGDVLRFDVEQQWRLVRALVDAPEIGVQFMFVSRTIEALLVEYALARGEPLERVLRAQSVMLEPGDSMSHDDHVHLRIACSREEMAQGCIGGGPYWEWLPPLPSATPFDERELLAALAAEGAPPPLAGASDTLGLAQGEAVP